MRLVHAGVAAICVVHRVDAAIDHVNLLLRLHLGALLLNITHEASLPILEGLNIHLNFVDTFRLLLGIVESLLQPMNIFIARVQRMLG